VLIFLALVAAVTVGIGLLLAIFRFATRGFAAAQGDIRVSGLTPLGLSLTEGALFVVPSIAALIMARIEHRKYGQYGLPARFAFRKDFWIGILVGFLSISGCLFGIFALHGFHLTGLAIHGSTIVSATAAWGATFILVGLVEEFAFRGYLQYTLTTGMGFWPTAILLSALFGLAHGPRPCWKSRREQSGLALGGSFRIAVLSVPASHRQPVVGCRLSRRMGLGTNFLLWRGGQRDPSISQPLWLGFQRAALAYGRHGWPGGECVHSHCARNRGDSIHSGLSRESL
jgi:membrane protease YdiL (CAAX protease family)